MDGMSQFAKAICLKNTSSAEIIRAFHIHWVANFGRPVEVYVDCGTNFGSYEFKQYAKIEGFTIKKSVPHAHHSNSVEWLHRSFIKMLRAALNSGDARPVSRNEWSLQPFSVTKILPRNRHRLHQPERTSHVMHRRSIEVNSGNDQTTNHGF